MEPSGALARVLSGFGCEVLAVSRRGAKQQAEPDVAFHGALDDLPGLLPRTDFLVVAIPLTPETRGLVNRHMIGAMKPGSYVINVARGPVVDYDALREALERGHLAGAGLDVFWAEPFPADDPLLKLNVIGTPHSGGATTENFEGICRVIGENVARLERGEILSHCVNADRVRQPR